MLVRGMIPPYHSRGDQSVAMLVSPSLHIYHSNGQHLALARPRAFMSTSSLPSPPPSPSSELPLRDYTSMLLDSFPVQAMQSLLEAIQTTTGLPWWASIAVTTVSVRLCVLPVVRYQAHAITRLAKSMPQVGCE